MGLQLTEIFSFFQPHVDFSCGRFGAAWNHKRDVKRTDHDIFASGLIKHMLNKLVRWVFNHLGVPVATAGIYFSATNKVPR